MNSKCKKIFSNEQRLDDEEERVIYTKQFF